MQRKTRVKRLSMLKDMLDRHDELFPNNIEPKVSGAKHVRGKVKPKHVAERVQFLIDWYSDNNYPAFEFIV